MAEVARKLSSWNTEPATAPQLQLVVGGAPRVALTIDRVLIARFHPVLLRVAQRLVGDGAQAEDIVQDTWISALSCAHTFEGRSSVSTWLIAIMRRRICDLHRRARFRMQELDESSWVSEPTWADQLHARDHLASLESSLDDLPSLEREAIMLCDVHELDRDEAAHELQVSRGHLRVLLHRGHLHIRQAVLGKAG